MVNRRANSAVAPFIVPTTGLFEGDDGSWSTYSVGVGTPPQTFRVLPSLISSSVWVPLPGGCEGPLAGVPNCPDLRGVNNATNKGFNTAASSTWDVLSVYQLFSEQTLFPADGALFGLDTVSINGSSAQVKLSEQAVGGITTEDFFFGSMGLGTSPWNFQPFLNNTVSSLLVNMKTNNVTPSLSFGYTAGKSYTSPQTPGSLILGGYNSARISGSTVSAPINSTTAQSLQISVQGILGQNTLQSVSQRLSSAPFTASLDSAVTQLWLPEDVCKSFALAFNLTYDSGTGLYLVDSYTHAKLQNSNPSVSFALGSPAGGDTINLQLSYNAFDLQVGIPFYNSSRPYFPIRQAVNASQYTLGRAFFQEAYLTVDWERGNFSIGAAASTTTDDVQIILPSTAASTSSSSSPSSTSSPTSSPHHSGISGGAIGGIVIAVLAIIALAIGAVFFVRRRNRRSGTSRRPAELEANSPPPPPFTDDPVFPSDKGQAKNDPQVSETPVYELHEDYKPSAATELASNPLHEMHQVISDRELMGTPILELVGSNAGSELDTASPRLEAFARPIHQRNLSELSDGSIERSPSVRPNNVRHLSGLSDTSLGSVPEIRPSNSRHMSGLSDISDERPLDGIANDLRSRHLSGVSDLASDSSERLSGLSSPGIVSPALPSPRFEERLAQLGALTEHAGEDEGHGKAVLKDGDDVKPRE